MLRNALRVLWALLNAASIFAWLFSLGVGGAVGAIAANALDLSQPWRGFFFVGVLLMTTAVALPLSRAGFSWLSGLLPSPKQQGGGGFTSGMLELAATEQHRKRRAALHEVITTLEDHKADIQRHVKARTPSYQGAWPENRQDLAGEPQYDRAVRATERAFQAITYHIGEAAIDPIDEALAELEAALGDKS